MFFHHPESEASLRRMAGAVLHGTAMEPSDIRLWPRIKRALKSIGWEALLAYLMCLLTGLHVPQFRAPAWQDFMLAGVVMLTSRLSCQHFNWLLQSSPTMAVLWHLPVAGRDICRWARRKHLLFSLTLLPRMVVAAWIWLGLPDIETAWTLILWNGLCLWLVMLACVQLYSYSQGPVRLLGKLWNTALIVWICMALYSWWWERNLSLGQALPSWVLTLCTPFSWVLPAQWAMHAAEFPIALMLTLACLAAGGLFWWRFPNTVGFAYDYLATGVDTEPADPDNVESANAAITETRLDEPVQVLASIQQAISDETLLNGKGWIESLALALMHQRNRALATILVGQQAGWTRRWWKGLRLCTLLLLVAYAMLTFGTRWITADAQVFWIVLVPLIAVAGFTFPVSNSIPLATFNWPLGQHAMPFFAGLPITVHELLRISFRVTAARMIACLALGLPVIAAQCVILSHAKVIPLVLGAAVILCISWVILRPVFIYYRLHQMCRPVRRHRLGHMFAYLLYVPLFLVALFSTVASVGLFQTHPAWLLICLPLTACCARGVYAVFHWRVRSRKVDWVIEP